MYLNVLIFNTNELLVLFYHPLNVIASIQSVIYFLNTKFLLQLIGFMQTNARNTVKVFIIQAKGYILNKLLGINN